MGVIEDHDGPGGDQPAQGGVGTKKPTVIRSARACTVCRNAKMRCIGADDGQQQCQRCKRQNLECIFEKHRRGRKPGSKLSEHSKALRRMEREAKAKHKEINDSQSIQQPQQQQQQQQQQLSEPGHPQPSSLPLPLSLSASVPIPVQSSSQPSSSASSAFPSSAAPPPGVSVALPPAPVVPSSYRRSPLPKLDPIHMGGGPTTAHHTHSGSIPNASVISPSHTHPQPPPSATSLVHSPFELRYSQPPQTAHSTGSFHDTKPGTAGGESADDSTPGDMEDSIYPARIVDRETKRQSYFRTILNPSSNGAHQSRRPKEVPTRAPTPPPRSANVDLNVRDPITAGILDEQMAIWLLEQVLTKLNPFINLFDYRLHNVSYIRARSPFLFSVLMMAGCKFFKAEFYRTCLAIAHNFAYRALIDDWKSVEVVQAFACLTYWKEPDDTRTWTWIGYACRMAIELGLNRYSRRYEKESPLQHLERRNRERTYLVLWVHDRSLSMQTGRQWMLPECDLVRHAENWHEDRPVRTEDVIIASFVMLRRLAAETTDVFFMHKDTVEDKHTDLDYELLLRGCNGKLTQWMDHWHSELKKANGHPFHFSFISFFRLHVRLFLNTLPLQPAFSDPHRSTSLQGLTNSYKSALQTLQIITQEFAPWGMLRYGQDSVTVMSAYAAVFLIKLLRRKAMFELTECSAHKIYDTIRQAADAYQEAALLAVSSSSAACHARFLKEIVAKDAESRQHILRDDRMEEDRMSSTATIPSQGPITPTHTNPIPYAPQLQQAPSSGRPSLSLSHPPLVGQPPQSRPLQPSPPLHPTVYANGTTHPQSIPPPVAQPPPPPPPAPVHMESGYPLYTSSSAPTVGPINPYIASAPPTHYGNEPSLELTADATYSRHMLESLGFRSDYHPNWFHQAMGPSASAGML